MTGGSTAAESFLVLGYSLFRTWSAIEVVYASVFKHSQTGRPWLAIVLALAWVTESVWLLNQIRKAGSFTSKRLFWIDMTMTSTLLVLTWFAHGPIPPERAFAVPFAYVTAIACGPTRQRWGTSIALACLLSVGLSATYSLGEQQALSTALKIFLTDGIVAVALAVGSVLLAREVRRMGSAVDTAHADAIAAEAELAAERERNRTARDLHDHVLQTLEVAARGAGLDERTTRAQASTEARRLRELITATPVPRVSALKESVRLRGRSGSELALMRGYLIFRAATIAWPLFVIPAALSQFKSPSLIAVVCLVAIIEAGAVAWHNIRRRSNADPRVATFDVLVASGCLFCSVLLAKHVDFAMVMCVWPMGAILGAGIAYRSRLSVSTVATVTTIAFLVPMAIQWHETIDPFFANATWYFGWGLGGWLLARHLRQAGDAIDVSTEVALEKARDLAVEREHEEMARLVAERVLPTLDALSEGPADAQGIRVGAIRAANWAQRFVQGMSANPQSETVSGTLREAIGSASGEISVDLNMAGLWLEGMDASLSSSSLASLGGAVLEALNNVIKHSGVDRATVYAAGSDGGINVSIVDHGKGFESELEAVGSGITRSITDRMSRAGGHARVITAPGQGTIVEIWLPTRMGAKT